MAHTRKSQLVDPLIDNNPITLQVLGICSALAVSALLRPVTGASRQPDTPSVASSSATIESVVFPSGSATASERSHRRICSASVS